MLLAHTHIHNEDDTENHTKDLALQQTRSRSKWTSTQVLISCTQRNTEHQMTRTIGWKSTYEKIVAHNYIQTTRWRRNFFSFLFQALYRWLFSSSSSTSVNEQGTTPRWRQPWYFWRGTLRGTTQVTHNEQNFAMNSLCPCTQIHQPTSHPALWTLIWALFFFFCQEPGSCVWQSHRHAIEAYISLASAAKRNPRLDTHTHTSTHPHTPTPTILGDCMQQESET